MQAEGIIKSWGRKGFGFIVSGEQTVFLHVREMLFAERSDMVGKRVSFTPGPPPPGKDSPVATKVVLL